MLQLARSMFLIAGLHGRVLGEHFVNVLVWELVAGVFWIAGVIADPDARLLLAQLFFSRSAVGQLARSRLLGLAALAILAAAAAQLTMIAGIAASTGVLVAVAASDTLAVTTTPAHELS